MQQSNPLYLADLMTGLFAALALRQFRSISLTSGRFERALEAMTETLRTEAEGANLEVMFRIRRHRVHGDSIALQEALYDAAKRDLISLDNPEFQHVTVKLSGADAPAFLERLPGSKELYEKLAEEFIHQYRAVN